MKEMEEIFHFCLKTRDMELINDKMIKAANIHKPFLFVNVSVQFLRKKIFFRMDFDFTQVKFVHDIQFLQRKKK